MEEVTLNITEEVETVVLNITEEVEEVHLFIVEGYYGEPLPPTDRRFVDDEAAVAGGFVPGDAYWLAVGSPIGQPGTLRIII